MVIQIARALGAEVFAVDGPGKAGAITGWGATPIDRARTVEDYVAEHTGGGGFDIAYDTVGGQGLDHAFQAVRRFGHAVSCLGWGSHALAPLSFKAGTYSGVFTLLPLLTGQGRERHGEILRQAVLLADAGRLTPAVDPRRFSLDQAAEAHRALADRTARGKLVIDL
jgi:NADPH2:quinone reductase